MHRSKLSELRESALNFNSCPKNLCYFHLKMFLKEKSIFLPLQESDGSQRCLEAHNYDKSMCSPYFINYKNCRKYWVSIF